MVLQGRKKDIFDILYEKGKASVTELSNALFVSEMTIRRDLREMESDGIIKRYRGGAVFSGADSIGITQRFFVDEDEKKRLGKKAAEYLHNGMTVYIDSSSTCQYIIPHVKTYSGMTVVTNSVNAVIMASGFHIPCFLIGGEYYEHDMCFVGSVSDSYADNLNVDIAFFSSLGISDDGLITDDDAKQMNVRKIIMRNSKKNVFLFEKSKMHKKFLYTLCKSEDADDVITE